MLTMPDAQSDLCWLCGESLAYVKPDSNVDAFSVRCPTCGEYHITQEANNFALPKLSPADRVRLQGAVNEIAQRHGIGEANELAELRTDTIDIYLANAPGQFDVATKARKLLAAIARRTPNPGEWFQLYGRFSRTLAYAAHNGELIYMTEYLKDSGWCEKQYIGAQIEMKLTPAGWEELSHRPRADSLQGFVAMSFAEVMKATYVEAIEPAIRDDCGYNCRRIDAKEYNGAVVDEIKAEIRESRFVVADLTNHRNGVYFEAGFADGLGIPVIYTCAEADADNTHFDTKHFNQIRWTSHEDLRKRLSDRVRGTIGRGPLEPRKQ
jgi:hypothetical protein